MDAEEIKVLQTTDLDEIGDVLTDFLEDSCNDFTFPSLSEGNARALVWTALFQHLQNPQTTEIHFLCLESIKILSRDKTDLDSLLCEKWINVLIERAGLYHLAAYDEESLPSANFPEKHIVIEALKCLYNLSFNSEVARALCAGSCLAEGLVCRLRIYRDLPNKSKIILYDLKLLFVLTAMREDFKLKVKHELHGMEYLVNCLKEILAEAAKLNPGHHVLNDCQQGLVCEILRTLFNLTSCSAVVNEGTNELEDSMFLQIAPLLFHLLLAEPTTLQKKVELRTNVANFLTSLPLTYYAELCPPVGTAADCTNSYGARDMDAVNVLIQLLEYRLDNCKEVQRQFEELSPILTVMHKLSRGSRELRKFLRINILPPLTDVSRPPEQGNTVRNQLCRLLTSPIVKVRDLVAEFLFILCKEKVGRFVKYTGFGNAAGHLAQRGLLGGGRGGEYSSSSDDSDTEEYRAAQPTLDPVVGCTRPPKPNPLEGMTDEQKEYEAMKLVNMLERLTTAGVVQPAVIGADGRPQPVAHVLELRDAPSHPRPN